jgi:DNA-binding NtrC family response regulator
LTSRIKDQKDTLRHKISSSLRSDSLTSQHKILIYSSDIAMRRAYATYLTRNGIPADSCGTLPELDRLLSWHTYDFVLVNVDHSHADTESQQFIPPLTEILHRYHTDTTIIATANDPTLEEAIWQQAWFLREPLTPRNLLTTISEIRSRQSKHGNERDHLRLRQYLSRPLVP